MSATPPNHRPLNNGSPPLTRLHVHTPIQYRDGSSSGITTSPDNASVHQSKPKQRRNKPTLSCIECVDRKTKCDRSRPNCNACQKRHSTCHYTLVAELITATRTIEDHKPGRVTKPVPRIKSHNAWSVSPNGAAIDLVEPNIKPNTDAHVQSKPRAGPAPYRSPSLMSHIPFTTSTPSNIFGIGDKYPFSNYWTCAGGIAEVVGVLPSKDQADILVARYFEVMHPVYPFIHRRTFYTRYESFWSSSPAEKIKADADMLALHYILYALGTQFMEFSSYDATASSAEFYASASTQSLRIYSYLNRASIESLSAMILVTYFLMNDNHASDAYAWAGVLLRQAYALRLNRDPDLIVPDAPHMEKQARRKLWQAVFFQDTFLTILLRLPPTATHSDVRLEALVDEATLIAQGVDTDINSSSRVRVENLMSINVIAPPSLTPQHAPPLPARYIGDPMADRRDVEYIQSMWRLGTFVQEHISSPLSLQSSLVSSHRHKTTLLTSMGALHRSFPQLLTRLDDQHLQAMAVTDPRSARQNLFLNSNYLHCVMLLQSSENYSAGVECNVRETLDAAHQALSVFFRFWRLFESEAGVWWVFQHRAFEEALTIARLLSLPPSGELTSADQQLHVDCKADVIHVVDLIRHSDRASQEMQRTRLHVLREALDQIVIS